ETAEGREAEVRRLFETEAGQDRAVRMIREWLGIDRILSTAKDSTIYPEFGQARADMAQETEDFVKEVLAENSGDVSELLGADWSIVGSNLAPVYGTGTGRV